MTKFIQVNDLRLSTPYDTEAEAQAVVNEMLKMRAFKKNLYTVSIIDGEVDATKRGHKNTKEQDPIKEAVRQYNNIKSLESKAKRNKESKDEEDFVDIEYAKERWGDKWRDHICDKDGICPFDEQRYRRRFQVEKHPSLRTIKRFTGLNIKQVYILQERTKLYPTPKLALDEVNNYIAKVKESGDSLYDGYDFEDDGMEDYSLLL